jgi:hypothetical protein
MAKFVITLVVETDEPKGAKPPTKKAIREMLLWEVPNSPVFGSAGDTCCYIDKARVRAIEPDRAR